jgi:hypothetical protein
MTTRLRDALWGCEQDALTVLKHEHVKGAEIIRTGSGVILYVVEGKPSTAWLSADGRTILRTDRGFTATYD